MKIILLNGPPRSGKDFAAKALRQHFGTTYNTKWEKFSFPIKRAFAGLVNAPIDEFGNVSHYEEHKDEIVPWLSKSYRQWQIDFAEQFMRPTYGVEIFAKLCLQLLATRIAEDNWLAFVSDYGFQLEVDHFADHVIPEDLLLIRLHRQGCTYSGDSREYVYRSPQHHYAIADIFNDGDESFARILKTTVEDWIG